MNVIARSETFPLTSYKSNDTFQCGQHRIISGKCDERLDELSTESVDVVVTSPPYNIGLRYDLYQDTMTEAAYIEWISQIGQKIARVLRSDGAFFLNISGSGTQPWLPFSIANGLRNLFHLQNHIVWVKSISIETQTSGHFKPISSERFLNQNHEHIFHFTKSNDAKIDRLSIGLPFTDKTNVTRWGHKRDLRCRGNTWFIPYKTVRSKRQKFNHPGTFPVELPLWCIWLHGRSDMTVLDPFSGSGTTLVAAHLAGAKGIGIDLDPTYNKIASERLRELVGKTMQISLTVTEIDTLMLQDPETAKDGGFQGLMVSLQNRVNKNTGLLVLTPDDLERIARYASKYKRGGWEDRLKAVFARSLGDSLGN